MEPRAGTRSRHDGNSETVGSRGGRIDVVWMLATLGDGRERCCVVIDGARCEQASARRISRSEGEDTEGEDTFVCAPHVALVVQPGNTVEPIPGI